MFSSWPLTAFVAGGKMGSGEGSDFRRPDGRSMPHTLPLAWYSFQADPEMYPRTTHSTGNISARCTIIDRPRNWSAYFCRACGYCATSAVITWLGTMSERKSNQNNDI